MEIALLILGGLALLAAGGELLVRGAVQIAERLGVSPLLIGLTLVGFGTSTPELVTSLQAALAGSPGIAVGNVVGSNIANILLILGLAALLCPVVVTTAALRRDGVLGLLLAALLAGLAAFWMLDRLVGAAFLAGLVLYLLLAWRQERGGTLDHGAAYAKAEAFEATHPGLHGAPQRRLARPVAMALAGLALVVAGGRLLVDGAIGAAERLGVPETVIGLTIVAVGTSLPELVTSVVAAARRQPDVAFGNVLGSNIYNILGILGATALAVPVEVPAAIARFDAPVMVAVAALMLLFAWTGLRIGRREGAALLAAYGLYLWALWPAG